MAGQDLLSKLDDLKRAAAASGVDLSESIRELEGRIGTSTPAQTSESIAWAKVGMARRQDRPKPQDIIIQVVDEFTEFRGDRGYGDDRAIVGGVGSFHGNPVTAIGTRRGNTLQTNMEYNFGMPHPEGYRKALRLAKQAEKFQRPALFFVDTPGAYPGIQSEERGISEAIARNLAELAVLKTPTIAVITGEGGSGGALALSVCDRILMFENAIFSVISPEGCASILFKDSTQAPKAAESLKLDAASLKEFGLVDRVIPEGPGLHLDPEGGIAALRSAIAAELSVLRSTPIERLVEERWEKFRRMGRFTEG